MEKFGEPIPLFRELRSTEWLIQAIDQQTVGVYKQTDPLPQEEDEAVLDLLSAVLLHNSFVRSHGRWDLGIWVWDEKKEVLTRQTLA